MSENKNSHPQSPSQPSKAESDVKAGASTAGASAIPFAQGFMKIGDRIECRKCGARIFVTDLPHACKQWRAR